VTTPASRQVRSARNALAEALGLGETYPIRDLPVRAEPPVAAFGADARVVIEDSELSVSYRLLDQDSKPLPGGAAPKGQGTGDDLALGAPPIKEDIGFTVHATTSSGRQAILFGTADVRVGLDDSLAVAIVPVGPVPTVLDHKSNVEVEVAGSQEGVKYRLVARRQGDSGASDDPAEMASDTALSAQIPGTGGMIRLTSMPLVDDAVVRVRAVKTFGGNKPNQTTLLRAELPVFVRPDSSLEVTVKPAIVDHGGKATIRIASAAGGVVYALHGRTIEDAEFSRLDPPDPATFAVATPDGPVHVLVPPPTPVWQEPEGFRRLGEAAPGTGSALSLPLPPLDADTMVVVEACKSHSSGQDAFTSAERLDQPAVVLVRPNSKPPLRLAAAVVDDRLRGLTALSGEPGVFYSLSAGQPLGELYFHKADVRDPSLNKGIGAIAVGVDLVVADGASLDPTSAAPPPLPHLDADAIALPADVTVEARRAMTGLKATLGKVRIGPLPAAQVSPPSVASGKGAKVVIAQPVPGELYAIAIDGKLVGDPVAGAGDSLNLVTGPLSPGARVELWARAGGAGGDSIEVERLAPLAVEVT
jgi:hypothetical protein